MTPIESALDGSLERSRDDRTLVPATCQATTTPTALHHHQEHNFDLSAICVEGFQAALAQYSPFEPVTALGFQRWAKAVGSLREKLDQRQWRAFDDRNAPRSLSPDEQVVIAAVGGGEATGTGRRPSNAQVKGRVLERETLGNAEALALPDEDVDFDIQAI